MKELVRLELEDGSAMFVEVEEGRRATGPERLAAHDKEWWEGGRLQRALAQVRPAAQAVLDAFRGVRPDEVQVEFSLTFDTGVNTFVFSSATEGTFKVSL